MSGRKLCHGRKLAAQVLSRQRLGSWMYMPTTSAIISTIYDTLQKSICREIRINRRQLCACPLVQIWRSSRYRISQQTRLASFSKSVCVGGTTPVWTLIISSLMRLASDCVDTYSWPGGSRREGMEGKLKMTRHA